MSDVVNEGSPAGRLAKSHLSLGVRSETLSDFLGQLKTSPHTEDLETWVRASEQDLFANAAIGRIKWSKAIGRPEALQLLAGFLSSPAVLGQYLAHTDLMAVSRPTFKAGCRVRLRPFGTPAGDSDHSSVGYMAYATK